jgi:small subunit ribosomal protein S6
MHPYEGMFLVDPTLHTADTEAVENTVKGLLEKHGAKIVQFDRWDERKLAYDINGHKRGIYLLTYFEMPGENVDAMQRETRIIECIMRQLVVRLDYDIPTYLAKSEDYYEKMRAEQEARRSRRDEQDGMGRDDMSRSHSGSSGSSMDSHHDR